MNYSAVTQGVVLCVRGGRLLSLIGALIVVLAAGGCVSTMTVSSHVREGLDITKYRTYDWGPADSLPTGDPRLENDPLFTDYLQGAVERQLAGKGIRLSDTGTADLLIHYHANIDQRIDVNRTEREYAYCQGADCESWVVEYEAGTLVLDVIDARTNQLLWRGWAQDTVKDILDDPDRMEAKVDEAVRRIFARFPGTP